MLGVAPKENKDNIKPILGLREVGYIQLYSGFTPVFVLTTPGSAGAWGMYMYIHVLYAYARD